MQARGLQTKCHKEGVSVSTTPSGASRRKSDRGSTLQVWAWCVWLAWKLDLCNDAVKQDPMTAIFRKLRSLKALEYEVTILQHAPSH